MGEVVGTPRADPVQAAEALVLHRRLAAAHARDVHVTAGDVGGARFEFSGVEFVSALAP